MPRIGNYEFPDELQYMNVSLWYNELEENRYRLGITDLTQQRLGDIVAIELPDPESNIQKGKILLSIESIQKEESFKAPIGLHVIKVNKTLNLEPELLNQDPYRNWIIEFRLLEEDDLDQLPDVEEILDEVIAIVEREGGSKNKNENLEFDDDYMFNDFDDDYSEDGYPEEDNYSSIFY